jgi:catechol 2,3-dioxygenase-like lactoylglutathione lyase family enzyme
MDVLETCLYASDLAGAREIYEGVLGLECFAFRPPRHVFFRAGHSLYVRDPAGNLVELAPASIWGLEDRVDG